MSSRGIATVVLPNRQMETRQYSFSQEQEHPDGLPKTEDDECAGYQRSHQGRVAQQRFSP